MSKKKITHLKVPDVDYPREGLCTVYVKVGNKDAEKQEWPRVKKQVVGSSTAITGKSAKNNQCPKCSSEEMEGEEIISLDDEVSQKIHCLECETEWEELYKQPDNYK